MRAGELRDEIELEQRVTDASGLNSADEFGQRLDVWKPVVKVRANITALSMREFLAAQGTAAGATHKITVRWIPQLENTAAVASMRARYRARLFNIKGAANVDERNREIWMLAEEGLNQG